MIVVYNQYETTIEKISVLSWPADFINLDFISIFPFQGKTNL